VSDGIYGLCRFFAVMNVAVAVYVAITGNIVAAIGLLVLAVVIYGLGLWSRRTHQRYGENNWRTSWSALFRKIR
jgi:hypothetical protein